MNPGKFRVGLVQWGNYRGFPVGGISTFVESILPALGRAFDLKLIGMSAGEPLGKWTKVELGGCSYDFLPVVLPEPCDYIPDRIRLAWALRRHRRAVLEADVDAYYVHMTEAAIPLLWGPPARDIVVHVHGLYNLFRFSRHKLGPLFAPFYELLYPALFSRCAKVLGAGTETEFEAFRRAMRVRDGSVVPTCVRSEIFYPRDRRESRRTLKVNDDVVLLFAGRLTDTKNPRLLLEAGKILKRAIPQLKLVFVGDGPLRAEIEAESRRCNWITSTGALDAESVALWMCAADALTVVSKTEAFTSIVALEALSCGTPVVATPVSALPEMIREGVNGVVCCDHDPEHYASSIASLLRRPPTPTSCISSVAQFGAESVGERVASELLSTITRGRGAIAKSQSQGMSI